MVTISALKLRSACILSIRTSLHRHLDTNEMVAGVFCPPEEVNQFGPSGGKSATSTYFVCLCASKQKKGKGHLARFTGSKPNNSISAGTSGARLD